MGTVDRTRFFETLESCERISALLLLALESGKPDPMQLLEERKTLVEELTCMLPSDINHAEVKRLEQLLESGERAKARVLEQRLAATNDLMALQRNLSLAQQVAVPRPTVEHQVQLDA